MKKATIAAAGFMLILGIASFAGEKIGTDEGRKARHVEKQAYSGTIDAGDEAKTWKTGIAEYKVDKATLETRFNAFAVDQIAATNAIAGTTGATKTALNKIQNEVEDLHKCLLTMRQMIQDLKAATAAEITKGK